ncbi:GspE/PulE family protein [Celerinatantimonas yamalensis]|uniref:GspE/PulE family protein n=1 Tax=Celerinatantimonas yamalensis TaxID=559956 RepID=A0ABW9G5X3_9GAMM
MRSIAEQLCFSMPAQSMLDTLQHQYPQRPQRWLLELLEHDLIDAESIMPLAKQLGDYPQQNLPHGVSLLPGQLQLHHLLDYQVILTSHFAGVLQVGLLDPSDHQLIEDLQTLSNQLIEPLLMEPFYLKAQLAILQLQSTNKPAAAQTLSSNDPSLSMQLSHLIEQASKQGVSDLHFEPTQQGYRVRARIDGLLQPFEQFRADTAMRVISWLKMNANLDIAQKRLPQDGRLILPHSTAATLDIRLSTLPTILGEKVVLRLLGHNQQHLTLPQLGMTPQQLEQMNQSLSQPQGMLIVTGPTGSGKTSTLYAALAHLNQPNINLASVEDPVEIQLPGVNQVAVNPAAELTFARLLRALLRQDPDVMMVGEIRDRETLNVAFHAEQTGHKVLTTLHTNSALDTINRLAQLGLSDYQIAASVKLIIAQRLVRRLCPHCRKEIDGNYQPVGCAHCHDGYKGRMGIFELLPITASLRCSLIGQNDAQLQQHVLKNATTTLYQQARQYVTQGLTTAAEIKRVLGDEQSTT